MLFLHYYYVILDSGELHEIEVCPNGSYLNALKLGKKGSSFLLFLSTADVPLKALKDILEKANKSKKPVLKEFKTKTSLSTAELEKIQSERSKESLPDGWFFNGSHYVSMSGDRSNYRPDIDIFINEYLENINSKIREFNSKQEHSSYIDLFQ